MKRSWFAVVLLVLFSVGALAQTENGQISGIVTDSTGAVIAAATATAVSVEKHTTRSTVTNSAGEYTLPGLQPGDWTVKIEASGFSAYQERVTVTVGSRNAVNAKMSVGAASTSVEVVAAGAAQVDTQTQEVSQVVSESEISQLPTLTRNPYALVEVSGNVSQEPSGANRGVGYSVNGQRASSTDLLLDGSENVNLFTAGVGQQVPLDSVQEFRMITNNFGSEYGRAAGGVVSVSTKSGTNAFHGSAYEFNRISATTANTYDNNANGIKKGKYTRNQFGFSLGGPVIKDKLFFFDSAEWLRVRSNANVIAEIPDAAWIAASSPVTQAFFTGPQAQLRSGLKNLGPVETVGDLAPACIVKGVNKCPTFSALPAGLNVVDEVSYAVPSDAGGGSPQNNLNNVARIDFNLSNKTTIFGRYGYNKINFFPGTVVNSPWAGYDTAETDKNQNFLLSVSHTFTPNLLNQVKFTFNRLNQLQGLGTQPVGPTLYLENVANVGYLGQPMAFPGYSEFTPGNAVPFGGPQNFGQISDDTILTKGKHQFRFGGEFLYVKDNRAFGAYEEAVEALGSNFNQAQEFFTTGNLHQFQTAINPQGTFPCVRNPDGSLNVTAACTLNLPVGQPSFSRSNRYHDGALYVNDSWRVLPTLTLNLGLRWEYYGVQHNNNQALDSNFYFGSGSTLVQQIEHGSVQIANKSSVGQLWTPRYHNFGPRVGFAYDVFGDGKTSLRGGYGISYERNFGNVTFNVIQNPPAYFVVALTAGADVPTLPMTLSNLGPFAGAGGTKALTPGSLRHVNQNIQPAYSEFYSFGIQRELARNTMVEVGYSGAHGIHQYDIAGFNYPGFGDLYLGTDPAVNAADRINRQYSSINTRGSNGFNHYNAMNARVSSSNLHNLGLTLNLNYTYSHSIDNISTTFSETAQTYNLGYVNPFQPNLDTGNSDYDVRHRVVISALWDVPLARHSTGFVKQVAGGWAFAPIYTARTGYPLTIYDPNYSVFGNVPRAFMSGPVSDHFSGGADLGGNNFNFLSYPTPIAYADPLLGGGEYPTCPALGSDPSQCNFPSTMSGRGAFKQPGWWNMDAGIYKTFKLTERFNMQFRSEFFNLFNHSNLFALTGGFATVGTTAGSLGAKKGTDLQTYSNGGLNPVERRFVQFALRLTF